MRRPPPFALVFLIALLTPRLTAGQSLQAATNHVSHTKQGALIGAGALLGYVVAAHKACRTGCEADAPMMLIGGMAAGVGALAGAAFGYSADRYADPARERRDNLYYVDRPAVRVGTSVAAMRFQSDRLTGSRTAPGVSVAFDVSPLVSAHVEYSGSNGTFDQAPGSIPDKVLANVVPATSRGAGLSQGIASRRVDFVLSELVGIHPRPWGRVRAEFVAGLAIAGGEDRDYYEEHIVVNGQSQLSGKYYILNFESPRTGMVVGANVEIAVARRISVVPAVRYQRLGEPGARLRYGVGAEWRF